MRSCTYPYVCQGLNAVLGANAQVARGGPRLELLDLRENGLSEAACAELCRLLGKPLKATLELAGGGQVLLSWHSHSGLVVRRTYNGQQPVNVFWHD